MAERMPALFIGHGNPMNALLVNPYTQRWAAIGAALPRPKAILSVSAHWYIEDAAVTVSTAPRTIHDFGGFPRELYQVQYPAPGDPDLARASRNCLRLCRCAATTAGVSTTVLGRFCATSIHKPIFRWFNSALMKRNRRRSTTRLASAWRLREEGILILGSGNVVHNLHAYAWGRHTPEPYDWAIRLRTESANCSSPEDHQPLMNYENQLGSEADLAVPTPDHYLPLLYVIGTRSLPSVSRFPWKGWMEDRFRCLHCKWDRNAGATGSTCGVCREPTVCRIGFSEPQKISNCPSRR